MSVQTEPAVIYTTCGLCGDINKIYIYINAYGLDEKGGQIGIEVDRIDTQETFDHHLFKHMDIEGIAEEGTYEDDE